MEIKKILVVDDDQIIRSVFQKIFERKYQGKYQVSIVKSGEEAIKKLKEETFDVVFVDILMPEMDGIDTLKALKEIKPDIIAIMMTGLAVEDKWQEAMKLGALDYLYKPFELSELQTVLDKLTER